MTSERRLMRRAARQLGVVTWDDALAAGLTPRQVHLRVKRGFLVPLFRGVYRVAAVPSSFEQSVMAGTLATGGVASHLTAAVLFELRGITTAGVEITVPAAGRSRLAGVTVHRSDLDRRDRCRKGALPVTTPARTLLDLAAVVPDLAEGAVDDALLRRLTRPALVMAVLERAGGRGRSGAVLLRSLIESHLNGRAPTQSKLEDDFLRLLRRHGLPEPVRQYRLSVPGGEIFLDFAYPWTKIAMETDGWRWHGGRAATRRDRQRDRWIRSLGWELVRVCSDDVRENPDEVAADIARLLLRRAG